MSTITRIETGQRMSQAVVHNGTIYLAGQVGAPGKSVADQTKAILKQIDRLLKLAGSNKSKILSAQIWLDDMRDFAEMNSVWDIWVDQENPPADVRSRKPLRAARVEVMDVEGEPGWYQVALSVRPHFKFMGANFELSLVGRLDRE